MTKRETCQWAKGPGVQRIPAAYGTPAYDKPYSRCHYPLPAPLMPKCVDVFVVYNEECDRCPCWTPKEKEATDAD